ncbi:MAG: hypothetical protein LCH85_23075 [Chloroflexi bacterium]|nr:hypothetical protein [Chloroflexota bacterium]
MSRVLSLYTEFMTYDRYLGLIEQLGCKPSIFSGEAYWSDMPDSACWVSMEQFNLEVLRIDRPQRWERLNQLMPSRYYNCILVEVHGGAIEYALALRFIKAFFQYRPFVLEDVAGLLYPPDQIMSLTHDMLNWDELDCEE